MKHLINREDYINEHLRFNINNDNNKLNEGLLGTIFGGLKMLLKKDWDNIKCKNPSVLKYLQDIDKNLTGYTMIKMQFSKECKTIRQNVADFFNDILDYKLSQIEKEDDPNEFLKKENKESEENKDAKGIEKTLNLKDKILLDSINKYKDNIRSSCKENPKIREYAYQMLNSVELFVNNVVLSELEKKGLEKETLDKKRKEMEDKKKELESIRQKMNDMAKKAGEEKLKEISKERDKAMRNLNIKPISAMDGNKAIGDITKQYMDMLGEFNNLKLNESLLPDNYSEILKSDTYIGIQKSLEELEWNFSDGEKNSQNGIYDKFLIRVILNKINTVFEVVSKNKEMFDDVPSASVQAMMVSLSNAIIYGFMGDKFKIDDNRLSLLTKCAIDSDATIGFNLPLIDPNKPENGNFFVSIMNQLKNSDISSKEVEEAANSITNEEKKSIMKVYSGKDEVDDISNFSKEFGSMIMKDFRQNITKLFDAIVIKANDIKEKAKKDRESEAAKTQQESE